MESIIALIKGTVKKVYTDSYTSKAGLEVNTKKALLVIELNDEPFKMNVEIPKKVEWEVGEDVEHYYEIFSTKTGYMIAKPIQ